MRTMFVIGLDMCVPTLFVFYLVCIMIVGGNVPDNRYRTHNRTRHECGQHNHSDYFRESSHGCDCDLEAAETIAINHSYTSQSSLYIELASSSLGSMSFLPSQW